MHITRPCLQNGRELSELNSKNTALCKWAKDLSRHVTEEGVQMAHKHMEGCMAPAVIREMQSKITPSYPHTC